MNPFSRLRTDIPHGARVWNAALGGKDNFAPDRKALEEITKVLPDFPKIAQESRAALKRVIDYLASNNHVTQFLDIGAGLPTEQNTHQVAQFWIGDARVVYVDNDPMVLNHARALLTSTPEGQTDYIDADVRNVEDILDGAARTLNFDQPVALILFGIMGNIEDLAEAKHLVERLVTALAPGSFVALNDGTAITEEQREAGEVARRAGHMYWLRTPEQITSFFDGMRLLLPGVVSTPLWRPTEDDAQPLPIHCGLAEVLARESGSYANVRGARLIPQWDEPPVRVPGFTASHATPRIAGRPWRRSPMRLTGRVVLEGAPYQ